MGILYVYSAIQTDDVSCCVGILGFFFFQAEDGIRDLVRSRGLGDVYKRQDITRGAAELMTSSLRFDAAALAQPATMAERLGALSLIHI